MAAMPHIRRSREQGARSRERGAPSAEQGAQRGPCPDPCSLLPADSEAGSHERRERMKEKIIRLSSSRRGKSGSTSGLAMYPCFDRSKSMLATSKTERRDMFRKLAKSAFETLPDPSAILLVMLKVAPRNCSANRNNF